MAGLSYWMSLTDQADEWICPLRPLQGGHILCIFFKNTNISLLGKHEVYRTSQTNMQFEQTNAQIHDPWLTFGFFIQKIDI
jgi:hypothetical protein